jgi:hypothetical protein
MYAEYSEPGLLGIQSLAYWVFRAWPIGYSEPALLGIHSLAYWVFRAWPIGYSEPGLTMCTDQIVNFLRA